MDSSAGPSHSSDLSAMAHNGDHWTLPNVSIVHESDKQATNIWDQNEVTAQSRKRLYDLSAVDFSMQPKTECTELPSDEMSRSCNGDQTITLYDLNQNQEQKVPVSHDKQPRASCSSITSSDPDGETSSQTGSTSGLDNQTMAVPCVVCGDKSSGKHYGQLTCEGCKSFFKRSVRRNLSYTCRGSRDCAVDPQHRNQCQYCRLRKCIKAGMRREAVQRGRINQASPLDYQYQLQPPGLNHIDSGRTYYMGNFVSVLLRAEPYPVGHMQNAQNLAAMDGLCELAARLLFSAVEWARNIPFFTELPLIDQVSLLRSSWSELFILNAAQCCPPLYISSMLSSTYHAPVSTSADGRFHQAGICTQEQTKYIHDQLERLAILRIDSAEFSCLKALVLFSPDVPGLHDMGTIQGLQDKTYSALDEYDRVQYTNQSGRSGRLLLRLPALKTINPAIVESLFFIRLTGKTPIETLIRDMLLSGNTFCWPASPEHQMNGGHRA